MSVILYPTEVTTIRNVQDRLSNMLASSSGSWTLELKFYRSNPASFKEGPAELIYTVASNQDPGTLSLFTGQDVLVGDSQLQQIVDSRLKSLWVARQTFRVEGEAYKLDGLEIRVGNAFLSGNFKGLVLEIFTESDQDVQSQVESAISRLGIDATATEFATTRTGLYKQYSKLNR